MGRILSARLPGFDDLADGFGEADGDVPRRVVGFHFPEVAVVADVVADAVLVHIGEGLFLSGEGFGDLEGFEDGAGVLFSTAEVVDLCDARGFAEFPHEAGHILAVDVVAHLLAFVAENLVFAAFEIAFHEVAEESVEFHAGVVRAGEAAAAQTAGGHVEIASVFLNHDIRRDFGGAEEGVFRLVDREGLGDAVFVGGIVVIPARVEFAERDGIWPIAVNFVRGHVDERRLGAGLAGGFEEVQCADGVGIKIIKRNRRCAVVRRLGGGVDDDVGLDFGNEVENALPVADVEFVVGEAWDEVGEAFLVPARVALGSKKCRALVVIHSVDGTALAGEKDRDFGTDEAGGASDEGFHREVMWCLRLRVSSRRCRTRETFFNKSEKNAEWQQDRTSSQRDTMSRYFENS